MELKVPGGRASLVGSIDDNGAPPLRTRVLLIATGTGRGIKEQWPMPGEHRYCPRSRYWSRSCVSGFHHHNSKDCCMTPRAAFHTETPGLLTVQLLRAYCRRFGDGCLVPARSPLWTKKESLWQPPTPEGCRAQRGRCTLELPDPKDSMLLASFYSEEAKAQTE